MKRGAIEECFRRFQAANADPRTELEYGSTFQLLIAVMLSAQATDRSVNLATRQFFPRHGTPQGILALGEAGLTDFIRTIGLYKTKARNVIRTCELLLERHDGEVPDRREDLEALPGVGRKTANVVLNTAFHQPTMAVDTHIFRVANRTGIAPGKNVLEVERALLRRVPKAYLLNAHHWLILHGRYVCVARKPKCPQCPINDLCEYPHKTRPDG
ncbi:MAG: endonuclease III [Castellaniella sp.]|uniref:endonuclease III n=1 Tax=Castellaniella sp. TaxID=1955812 RepID=UPI001214DD84|nr:endonuclease III [Castellaniella sp.]TAN30233.1 MAG: endonuclease III [Castellaniella sp.]